MKNIFEIMGMTVIILGLLAWLGFAFNYELLKYEAAKITVDGCNDKR